MNSKNVFAVIVAVIIAVVAFFFTLVCVTFITQMFPVFHAGQLVGFVEELNGLGNFVTIALPITAAIAAGYFMYRDVRK